jgi:hypothetical protein
LLTSFERKKKIKLNSSLLILYLPRRKIPRRRNSQHRREERSLRPEHYVRSYPRREEEEEQRRVVTYRPSAAVPSLNRRARRALQFGHQQPTASISQAILSPRYQRVPLVAQDQREALDIRIPVRYRENVLQRQVFYCPTIESNQLEELVPKIIISSSNTESQPEEAATSGSKAESPLTTEVATDEIRESRESPAATEEEEEFLRIDTEDEWGD